MESGLRKIPKIPENTFLEPELLECLVEPLKLPEMRMEIQEPRPGPKTLGMDEESKSEVGRGVERTGGFKEAPQLVHERRAFHPILPLEKRRKQVKIASDLHCLSIIESGSRASFRTIALLCAKLKYKMETRARRAQIQYARPDCARCIESRRVAHKKNRS